MLPVWLLLMFAPQWRWTQRLATFVIPLLLTGPRADVLFGPVGLMLYLLLRLAIRREVGT